MNSIVESIFNGKWRSFKTFKYSGNIKFSSYNKYTEFEFTNTRLLKIRAHSVDKVDEVARTENWTVAFKNKKHYLEIISHKMTYEVITINHTVMVLSDTSSSDKIFFAREEHWESFLQSNHQPAL